MEVRARPTEAVVLGPPLADFVVVEHRARPEQPLEKRESARRCRVRRRARRVFGGGGGWAAASRPVKQASGEKQVGGAGRSRQRPVRVPPPGGRPWWTRTKPSLAKKKTKMDVALTRQGEPDADGVTVDRRDGMGLRHVPRRRLHGRSGEVVTPAAPRNVSPPGSMSAPAQKARPAPVTTNRVRRRRRRRTRRRRGRTPEKMAPLERVETIATVQGDDCDTVCRLDGDRIVVHDARRLVGKKN